MEITQTQNGEVLIFAIQGKLDSQTSKTFEGRLLPPIEQGNKKILVDFSEMDYISSAGLRVLLLAVRKLSDGNGKIALCALKPPIKNVFDIAGFSAVFPIFPSPTEALDELKK